LKEAHVREFDSTGRVRKGWVLVTPEGVGDNDHWRGWSERARTFVEKLPRK